MDSPGRTDVQRGRNGRTLLCTAEQLNQVDPQVTRWALPLQNLLQQLDRSPGMAAHPCGNLLANLDAGGGQLDESFQEVGHISFTSGAMPKFFPDLMSFPVIAVVEEIDAV
jgi:hypothetical protein